jgi:glyoxylase-like metal-dependent hydrolase (beta-lactamase superfamily II)
MALYQAEREILFLGDVFFHRQEGPGLPPDIVSVDVELAARSARKVAALPAEVACFGHGKPLLAGASEQLRSAAGAS